MARWTARLGDEQVSVQCRDAAAEHVPWLLQRLSAAHEQGLPLTEGSVLRFGWSVLVLRREPDGRLQVCEPDFDGDPGCQLRPDVSTTLTVQAHTRDLLQHFGVTPQPVAYDETVRVAGDVLNDHTLHLVRGPARGRCTGWYIGGGPGASADPLADPLPVPVHRLLVHRPTLLPALALPAGYVVLVEGEHITQVIDPRNRRVRRLPAAAPAQV